MGSQRAGNVVEANLPQGGVIEESFDQDYCGFRLHLLPAVEATLGAGKKR